MKWLITGGCGFIGTGLIKRLIEDGGHSIRVIDNLSVGTRDDLGRICKFSEVDIEDIGGEARVELIVGDILDEFLAVDVAQGVDVIVHLAANTGVGPSVENPRKDCITNVIGTLNYLEAARINGIGRFVFASSGAPIGECTPPIHEEVPPHPVSPYGASKLSGEAYCSAYYRTYGVNTVALRFGNVYGPGSGHKTSVAAKFIRQAMNGETLEIYGDGKQTRDFIFIDDLIRAIQLAAATEGIGGETFQIATSTETTVTEIVEHLIPLLSDFGIQNIEVKHGEIRKGDVRRNFSDTSKALKMLGWRANVDIDNGLRQTVQWFCNGKSREWMTN